MKCDYCGELAELVTGKEVYPHLPHLHEKKIYRCKPCQAWVGTHDGSSKPLGRLANKELRGLKIQAHAAFDPIWKSGDMSRKDAYRWLSGEIGIPNIFCHIGMFDEDTCMKVINACEKMGAKK